MVPFMIFSLSLLTARVRSGMAMMPLQAGARSTERARFADGEPTKARHCDS
jgi:hypothetical protein